ncbi:MAG: hypothetical protein JNL11_09525 [Bdellovibrionaceae bacterium]|nr:hypothetical protein [Pseudobdellovibrionaceae bacterium]
MRLLARKIQLAVARCLLPLQVFSLLLIGPPSEATEPSVSPFISSDQSHLRPSMFSIRVLPDKDIKSCSIFYGSHNRFRAEVTLRVGTRSMVKYFRFNTHGRDHVVNDLIGTIFNQWQARNYTTPDKIQKLADLDHSLASSNAEHWLEVTPDGLIQGYRIYDGMNSPLPIERTNPDFPFSKLRTEKGYPVFEIGLVASSAEYENGLVSIMRNISARLSNKAFSEHNKRDTGRIKVVLQTRSSQIRLFTPFGFRDGRELPNGLVEMETNLHNLHRQAHYYNQAVRKRTTEPTPFRLEGVGGDDIFRPVVALDIFGGKEKQEKIFSVTELFNEVETLWEMHFRNRH